MRVRKYISAVTVAAAVAALTMTAAAQAKIDVTGKWLFSVQTEAGTGEPTVTLKQDGEKLTGHYSSQTLGEADLTGTISGNKIEFKFNADMQGQALPVTYSGTVEKDTMKGTLDLGGMAGGTFTAKKQ
jgi:uncharacterized lipoprotein NlpE involved in copper resistance